MKNYVVIGGSSGIGAAVIELLKQENATIYSTYYTNVVDSLSNVHFQKFDVLNDNLNVDFFPEEIHGLVYCPGSINLKPFHRFTEDDFIQDFRLQALGATKIIQQLLPRLKKSGTSSIVLFSTIAVQNGFNFHAQVAMSKGAIEGLTRALSAEFAPNIRVNAVAPSITQTPLAQRLLSTEEKVSAQADKNPLKKIGTPQDIAQAVLYLLTEKSSWITGQILHIDGGYSTIK